MNHDSIELAVIKNSIRTLCVVCAGDENKLIDLITGYLWDEEEASDIKRSSGQFDVMEGICKECKGTGQILYEDESDPEGSIVPCEYCNDFYRKKL